MGKMSEYRKDSNSTTPDDLITREARRLVQLNDRLEKKLGAPFVVDPDDVKEIARVAAAISTLGYCTESIEPAVFFNEATRLQRVNEKLEPLLENNGDLVEALLNNTAVIAQLLEEAAIAESRARRHRKKPHNDER